VVQKVLDQAWADARTQGHEYVTPEHILLAVLDHPPALRLLSRCGADIAYIHDSVDEYLRKNMPVLTGKEPLQTVGFQNVFQRALYHCESAEKSVLEIGDVLVSLIDEHKNYCSYYMRRGGLDRLVLLEVISHGGIDADSVSPEDSSTNLFDEGISEDPNLAGEAPFISGMDALSRHMEKDRRKRIENGDSPGDPDEDMPDDQSGSRQKPARRSMLELYTV
jgi:ATP-dependent Clp protease ATP-binding subunit ClpA